MVDKKDNSGLNSLTGDLLGGKSVKESTGGSTVSTKPVSKKATQKALQGELAVQGGVVGDRLDGKPGVQDLLQNGGKGEERPSHSGATVPPKSQNPSASVTDSVTTSVTETSPLVSQNTVSKDRDLPIDQRPILYGPAGAIKNLRYCGAKTSAGGYCKKPAMKNGRCNFHGGGAAHGMMASQYKHGKYSKYLPVHLLKTYERSLNDPDLLSLGNEMAVVDSRLLELIEKLDKGESGRMWVVAETVYAQLVQALRAGSLQDINKQMTRLGEILGKGKDEYGLWKEIGEQMDRRRSLADTERRRLIDGQYMVDVEKAKTLVAALVASVRKHVTDPKALTAIADDFNRLTS